jgi:hypothetical protein
VSLIGTVTLGDTDIDVYGTVCPAEPDVGLMSDYAEIEDLEIGGVSVYEMLANSDLMPKIEERINDQLGG